MILKACISNSLAPAPASLTGKAKQAYAVCRNVCIFKVVIETKTRTSRPALCARLAANCHFVVLGKDGIRKIETRLLLEPQASKPGHTYICMYVCMYVCTTV